MVDWLSVILEGRHGVSGVSGAALQPRSWPGECQIPRTGVFPCQKLPQTEGPLIAPGSPWSNRCGSWPGGPCTGKTEGTLAVEHGQSRSPWGEREFDFNRTVSPSISGMGQPIVKTENGTFEFNATFGAATYYS
jgi:hypothetical protein